MVVSILTKLSIFLSGIERSMEEILEYLISDVFIELNAISIVVGQVNDNNEIEVISRYGVSEQDLLSLSDTCNLDLTYPSTDAYRQGKIVWINTLPSWGENYPLLKKLPDEFEGKTYIVLPLYTSGTPLATMAITSSEKLDASQEIQEFIWAVSRIFSLYVYPRHFRPPIPLIT